MRSLLVILALALPTAASVAEDSPYAIIPFQCADTTIKEMSARLVDGSTGQPIPNSGAAMTLSNGVYLVSYETPEGFLRERVGDKVQVCLIGIPKNCPVGDDRGKLFRLYDYRHQAAYTMSNSEHMCGGA